MSNILVLTAVQKQLNSFYRLYVFDRKW